MAGHIEVEHDKNSPQVSEHHLLESSPELAEDKLFSKTFEGQVPPRPGVRMTEPEQAAHNQLSSPINPPDSKNPSNHADQFPWFQSGRFFPSSAHSQLFSDSRQAGNAHLKPLSFPEKSGETLSCFISEESDLPIQCLLCIAVFNSETASNSNSSEITTDTNSSQGGTETASQSGNVCSGPPKNDPHENCSSISKDLPIDSGHQTEGVVAAKSTPKPPRAKLTPKDEWLRHLLLEHKIVIHNVQEISSLKW